MVDFTFLLNDLFIEEQKKLSIYEERKMLSF